MTELRVLHVDDEPDIREVVEISLGLDPDLLTQSCASGQEALVAAADWAPDIILLDVMMPVMDGPATLAGLRQNARTAGIPVVFMTARAQAREVDRVRSLGAVGVIAKPFDPMTLAASVRSYVQPLRDSLDNLRKQFLERIRSDGAALSQDRNALNGGPRRRDTLDRIQRVAHSLSGAGGIYGFAELSDAAAALEDAVMLELADGDFRNETDLALNGLISLTENGGTVSSVAEYVSHGAW